MRPDAVSLVFKFLAGVAILIAAVGVLFAISSTDPKGIGTAVGSMLWVGLAGIFYGIGVITRPTSEKPLVQAPPKAKLTPEQAEALIGGKKAAKSTQPKTYKID